jgi:hypothetical protein
MLPKNSDSIPSSESYESSRQPWTLADRHDLILNAGSPLTSSNGRNSSHGKVYEKDYAKRPQ